MERATLPKQEQANDCNLRVNHFESVHKLSAMKIPVWPSHDETKTTFEPMTLSVMLNDLFWFFARFAIGLLHRLVLTFRRSEPGR